MKALSAASFLLVFAILGVLLFLSHQANTSISEEYQLAYDDIISQKDTISRALSRSYFFLEKLTLNDRDIVFDARSLIAHTRSSQHIDLDVLQKMFAQDDTEVLQDLVVSLGAYQESASRLVARLNTLLENSTSLEVAQNRQVIGEDIHDFVRKATLHDVALMHTEASFSQKIKSGLGKTNELIFYVVIAFSTVLTTAIIFLLLNETERKKSQLRLEKSTARLVESEEKLRAIFKANPDPTVVYDREGCPLYLNPSFSDVFGWNLDELSGQRIPYVPENQRSITAAKIDEAYASGKPVRFVSQRHTKTNALIDVIISGAVIKAPHEEAIGIVVNLTDISQQKSLEAQLQQSQKLESVGRLAGGVAHDFNNMLGVIMGHTELVMHKLDKTDPLTQNLTQIHEAAKRSATLTGQLLAFARRQTAQPKVLDLNETITGMLKMLGSLIGEEIDLVWQPAKELWPIKIDPIQIDQILVNLCINAKDAIAGVGRVVITTEKQIVEHAEDVHEVMIKPGSYTVLRVNDDGCGMDKNTLDRVFEPFFTTKSMGQGTGLGLSMVYGVVKQNAGYIVVDSETGQGSTFAVYLPASLELPEPEFHEENIALVGGDETILVVEDENSILDLSKSALEQFGYTVHTAQNPIDALTIVKKTSQKIDLLITDVVMPEMNGKELKQHILELVPGVRVLFMSGYTSDIILNRGIIEGDVNFLQKPFSIKQLIAEVRKVLDEEIA